MIPLSASSAELIAVYRNGPATLRQAVSGMDADSLRADPSPAR